MSHLSEELFDSVAAHELVHVWFAQRWSGDLDACTTEGLCQLAAAEVLRSRSTTLAGYQLWKMARDPSYEYGECYRRAERRAGKAGLRAAVDLVRRGGRFSMDAGQSRS